MTKEIKKQKQHLRKSSYEKKEKMNFFWKKWLKDLFSQFEQKKRMEIFWFLIFVGTKDEVYVIINRGNSSLKAQNCPKI